MTALHCAAAAGQLEAAKLLSKAGADPAIADLQGRYAEAFIHMSAAHPSLFSRGVGAVRSPEAAAEGCKLCAWPF